MPEIIRNFPWPKSMRWGAKSSESGSLRWVRPLQSILCTFGPETEEPQVIAFEAGGVTSGNVTYGHRFHAPDAITVRRFDDYVSALEKAKVVLDAERRKDMIRTDAQNLAFAKGLELVEDEALLEEVANLVEWPVPLIGSFEADYLDIPDEVIRLTIKENQKCFVLRKGQGGAGEQESALTNDFILVSNIEASDGGAEIARGNAKVVNARLSDAKFFWETDLQQVKTEGFQPWLDKLDTVIFHHKLGSQGERVKRIMARAEELAPVVGADPAKAKEAARIAKADLNSLMVNEFPELQGFMGRQYALAAGEDEAVATACEDHYKPQGPSDDLPTDPVSVAVALADKLDTLVGFWAIDEKPTGSKDPYALRRAALGAIRLVLENKLRLLLLSTFLRVPGKTGRVADGSTSTVREAVDAAFEPYTNLLAFFHDRLKVYLRDSGARHDLIDAVITSDSDDLLAITRRVEALGSFLETDDGKNLLAGTKRAANILAAEEKKNTAIAETVDSDLFETDEERALFDSLEEAENFAAQAIEAEDYAKAMSFLSQLRAPVDNFFEHVMVNAENDNIRANRLALMRRIRDATGTVADFSKIAG